MYLMWHRKPISKDVMSGLIAARTDVFVPVIKDNWDGLEMQGWKVLLDLLKFGPRDLKISSVHYIFNKREVGESHISNKVVYTTFHQCGCVGRALAKVYAKVKHIDVRFGARCSALPSS
jgi:dolichol-phosphate mannosyltransferase